jgi:hypothetical protein
MSDPHYLGDGLYAKIEDGSLVLMANSCVDPTDTVYLEPSVWENLKKFADGPKFKRVTLAELEEERLTGSGLKLPGRKVKIRGQSDDLVNVEGAEREFADCEFKVMKITLPFGEVVKVTFEYRDGWEADLSLPEGSRVEIEEFPHV